MIADIKKGSQFRGVVAYVFAPNHKPEAIGGSLSGRDPRTVAREFAEIHRLRPEVEKPVLHVSLSFDPGTVGRVGDRRLTDSEMLGIAREYLRRMGYDPAKTPWVAVRHNDQPHQHVHLVVSRIGIDGSLVREQHRDFLKNKEVCRSLERDFNLRTVVMTRDPGRRPPTRGEDRAQRERGIVSQKAKLHDAVLEAVKGRPSVGEFVAKLRRQEVEVQFNRASTGHVSGISFRLGHVAVRGSQLGRNFSWAGLQKIHGLDYDRVRDLGVVASGQGVRLRRELGRSTPDLIRGFAQRRLKRSARKVLNTLVPPVGFVVKAALDARGATATLARRNPTEIAIRLVGVGPPSQFVLSAIRRIVRSTREAPEIERTIPTGPPDREGRR